ncbi:hypothetical protein BC830DRAFT_206506 [Chytriomyces sp. MP71]|nr:hypothetical protein BC830DRAFT_206506 [Chytriomyces sp. MP71]
MEKLLKDCGHTMNMRRKRPQGQSQLRVSKSRRSEERMAVAFCRYFGVKGSWNPGIAVLFKLVDLDDYILGSRFLLKFDKIDVTRGYENGNLMICLDRAKDARFIYPISNFLNWRDAVMELPWRQEDQQISSINRPIHRRSNPQTLLHFPQQILKSYQNCGAAMYLALLSNQARPFRDLKQMRLKSTKSSGPKFSKLETDAP